MTPASPRPRFLGPRGGALWWWMAAACSGSLEDDEVVALCEPVCDEVVDACALPSYPDRDSCMGGCAFVAQEGGDLEGYATCLREADCDLFEIIDCEHVYGID